MKVILTGCAGFIGMHVTQQLISEGYEVVGLDNVNDYYDVNLKYARLNLLRPHSQFTFIKTNIEDPVSIGKIFKDHKDADYVIHLAAQAGVRYSLENPYAYITSNMMGHTVMIEAARSLPNLKHFVYASSSSVYGNNTDMPFSTADRVDTPLSLYAATKKSCEMISHCYASLYQIPQTGLRFFTVYGPYGRPDMAAYIFASQIVAGKPIQLFNNGNMKRDFTFIEDIVSGVVASMKRVAQKDERGVPHKVYNLGNHRSEKLIDFVNILEREFGRKAIIENKPMQMGDVPATYADIEESTKDLNFIPKTTINDGLKKFVNWYKVYHNVN